MKPELQDKLIEIISGIQEAVKRTADFAMEQLPDIAWQYVAFGRVVSVFYSVIAFAILVLCIVWLFRLWLHPSKNDWGDRTEENGIAIFLTLWAVAGSLFAFVNTVSTAFLVWFAPKVWLLKELAGLVK